MRWHLVIAAVCVLFSPVAPPGPQPSDLFLAPLSMHDGRPVIGTPVNVTNRAAWRAGGYDNQPTFTPDGRAILFTSKRDDAQSDIYRYDIASKTTTRVTATPESESSPTVMPGGTRFSAVRLERDVVRIGRRRLDPELTQRLWSFALDGSDGQVVLPSVKPIGEYVWIDASNLAVFVFGRPNVLVHADTRTGMSDTLRLDVGWSLAALPDHSGVSFTHRVDSASMLASIRWPGRTSRDLVALPRGSSSVAWLSSDMVLTSSNTKILYWRAGATAWTEAADLTDAGLAYIGRLSVSPDGKWLAIVAFPAVCPTGANSIFEAFAKAPTGFEVAKSSPMPQSCLVPDRE